MASEWGVSRGVTEANRPSLRALEEQSAPCFLWDSDRLRIVWANEAGLRLFKAETLFDLLDRPFDRGEPGAALVRALKTDLGPKESRRETLKFPSAGVEAQFSAQCSLYRLDDGRQGVITIGEKDDDKRETDMRPIAEAFEALPQPVLIAGPDGAIKHRNALALEYLEVSGDGTVAALLGDADAAKDLQSRVMKAGLVSEVRALETGLGVREFRLTARRLGKEGRFVMMFEDVTERRRLERTLSEKGRLEIEAPPSGESTPLRPAAEVPLIVRAKLDALKDAICIMRGAELLFANAPALALFKTASLKALRERSDVMSALGSTQTHAAVNLAGGEQLSLALKRSNVPWNKGKAMQVKLLRHAEETVGSPGTELEFAL